MRVPRKELSGMIVPVVTPFDHEETIDHARLGALVDLMVRNSNPTGTIKAAMRARGLDAGVPRKPGRDVSADGMAALRDWARVVDADEPRFGQSVPLARSHLVRLSDRRPPSCRPGR